MAESAVNRAIDEPVNASMISRVTVANAVSIDLFSWLILFIQFIMIVYRRRILLFPGAFMKRSLSL